MSPNPHLRQIIGPRRHCGFARPLYGVIIDPSKPVILTPAPKSDTLSSSIWRGGRAAECAGFESRGTGFLPNIAFRRKSLQVLTLCHLRCGFGRRKLQTPSPKIIPDLVETGIETGMNSQVFGAAGDLFKKPGATACRSASAHAKKKPAPHRSRCRFPPATLVGLSLLMPAIPCRAALRRRLDRPWRLRKAGPPSPFSFASNFAG